ncbi:MAG: FliH/SctL family protein [Myxococcota bacterium]
MSQPFEPFPEVARPFDAWRRERWLPPAPPPPPDLEVHGPPAVDPDELPGLLAEAREAGAQAVREELEGELTSLRETVEHLGPVLDDLARLRHATLLTAAEDVAEIVRLFARKVVGDSVVLHPEALPRIVKEALQQLPDADEVTLVVSPQASESLSRHLDSSLRERLTVDPELGEGVIVRTHHATLDATLRHAEQALDSAIQSWLSEQWWVESP